MTGPQPRSQTQSHLAPLDTGTRRGKGPGHAHRYSYIQTPIEYQGEFSPSDLRLQQIRDSDSTKSDLSQSNNSSISDNANMALPHPESSHLSTVMEEPSPRTATATAPAPAPAPTTAMVSRLSSVYTHPASPPPLSRHPDNFVPYTRPDEPARTFTPVQYHQQQQQQPPPQHAQQNRLSITTPPPSAQQTRLSITTPPPIAQPPQHTPSNAQQLRREKEWGVVPDDNPLTMGSPVSTTFTGTTVTGDHPRLGSQSKYQASTSTHSPGQIRHPHQAIKGGPWGHGLCDPTDVGACCMGLLCPCILYGKTQHRLSMKSNKKDPTNMLGYETCNASCTAMALLCGCQCTFEAPHTPSLSNPMLICLY